MASSLPGSQQNALSDHESHDYRPISIAAVIGALVGAASVVAFVEPLLWLVPILGFALSAIGLWQINHSEPPMSGRWVAVLGLMLSTAFGVSAPTRFVARDWVLSRRAQQFADAWFEHLENGRLYQAHQFTVHPHVRMPLDSSLEQLYETDPPSKEDYGKFLVKPPMDVIAAQGKGMKVRHLAHTGSAASPEADSFAELYEVEFAPGSQPAKLRVHLMIVRTLDPHSGEEGWVIRYIQPGDNFQL